MDKTLEQRVEELEKRVDELMEATQPQNLEIIINKTSLANHIKSIELAKQRHNKLNP